MHIKNVINKQNTHKSGGSGGEVTGIINRLQAALHLETRRCKCWLWLLLQWELLLLLLQLMLLLLLLPFKLLLLLQLFLRPFRGAVSFCLPTFLMPQKKVTHLRQGCHTRHTNLPRHFARPLSLSFCLSLRHLATHCDTLAVKLITLLAIPAQSPVDCSALDWFADCQRVFHLHLHLHFTSLTHLCLPVCVCLCVCVANYN